MKNHVVIKSIALFFSWLTLSPLLLILDGRWKLLTKCLRVVLFLISPMVLAIVWGAYLTSSYLSEQRWDELCDGLYWEAAQYQRYDRKPHRLRVLSDKEIDALTANVRKHPSEQIDIHEFAYHKYWPTSTWAGDDYRCFDDDRYIERDYIVDFLEEKRKTGDVDIQVFSVKYARCSLCFRNQVVLLEYSTPLSTWIRLCGRGSSMLYCAHCDKMLSYNYYLN